MLRWVKLEGHTHHPWRRVTEEKHTTRCSENALRNEILLTSLCVEAVGWGRREWVMEWNSSEIWWFTFRDSFRIFFYFWVLCLPSYYINRSLVLMGVSLGDGSLGFSAIRERGRCKMYVCKNERHTECEWVNMFHIYGQGRGWNEQEVLEVWWGSIRHTDLAGRNKRLLW